MLSIQDGARVDSTSPSHLLCRDAEVEALVSKLDQAFLAHLFSGVDEGLTTLLYTVHTTVASALASCTLTDATRDHTQRVLSRIQAVSGGLASFSRQSILIQKQAAEAVQAALTDGKEICEPLRESSDAEKVFTPLRDWFLAHFDYPYPDEKAYTFLGEQLPSMTRHQIATWFINARRRSGWTDFRRDFAEEDYHNFQHLLATIDAPGNEAAKKRYDKVRLYFEPARKDVVSETILEVIKQGTPKDLPSKHAPARAVQRVKKRAARGVGARHDEEDELAPAVQGSWSPRRRNELPAAASSPSPAPPFNPIVDFHCNTTPSPGSSSVPGVALPRFPSTFVSPATSARSFSGSSSSSLDSLVSYGSSDYAPHTMRMEHTMPSNGSPAISVVPQQQQRTSTSSSQILALPALAFLHIRPGPSTFSSPARPHPYFCTLNELPAVPNFRGGFANAIPR